MNTPPMVSNNSAAGDPVLKLSDERLQACLCCALGCEDNLRITRRSRIRSFRHHLETVHVSYSMNGCQPRDLDLFVRVYRGQISWCDVARSDLPEREWVTWQIARRARLPMPHTFWHGWFDGTAVAVQQKMADKTLWHVRTPALFQQCGRLLARIHEVDVDERDSVHLVDARVPSLLERLAQWAKEARDDLSLRAVGLLRARSADVEERPAVFLHGDCHAENFLSDGRRITAILDWEDGSCGDPRFDLARMDMYLRWFGIFDGWLRRRKMNLLADVFLESYREATGWDPGSLQFWKCLIDVRTLVISAWIKHRAELGLPCPRTDHKVWFRIGRQVRKSVGRWVDSS